MLGEVSKTQKDKYNCLCNISKIEKFIEKQSRGYQGLGWEEMGNNC